MLRVYHIILFGVGAIAGVILFSLPLSGHTIRLCALALVVIGGLVGVYIEFSWSRKHAQSPQAQQSLSKE